MINQHRICVQTCSTTNIFFAECGKCIFVPTPCDTCKTLFRYLWQWISIQNDFVLYAPMRLFVRKRIHLNLLHLFYSLGLCGFAVLKRHFFLLELVPLGFVTNGIRVTFLCIICLRFISDKEFLLFGPKQKVPVTSETRLNMYWAVRKPISNPFSRKVIICADYLWVWERDGDNKN